MAALEAIHNALKPLDAASRRRVLASVYSLLDIPPGGVQSQTSGQSSSTISTRPFEPQAKVSSVRPKSLVELMQEKKPATNAQRIALFAYYREIHDNQPRFSRGNLEHYFGLAKEKPPGNYDRDFVEAVKNGWIHEDGTESYITSKGIEAVEAGFSVQPRGGRATKTTSQKRKQKSRPSKSK